MIFTDVVFFFLFFLGQTRSFVVRGGVWVDISFGGFRRTGFAKADEVKAVLNTRFCSDDVKSLLSGNTCSIQSVEFKVRKHSPESSATGMGQHPICKLKWDFLRTSVTACTIDKNTFSAPFGIFNVRT